MYPKIGSYVPITAYKHDGHIRRNWDQAFVLDCKPNSMVLVTNKSWVWDDDGRKWYTREPALCYFYEDRWFNVIAMLRQTGIYYYVNLASPAVYDGEAIKYIDYDLDFKFYPDGDPLLLDEDEYAEHREEMHYPEEIDSILKKYMEIIRKMYDNREGPFDPEQNEAAFQQYLDMLSRR